MKAVFLKGILALILLCITPAAMHASEDARRIITVTGEAEIEVAPDEVIITAEAHTEDPDAAEARRANDSLATKIIAIAERFDIPRDKIKARHTRVSPQYDYVDRKRILRGYVASTTVEMISTDVDKYDNILRALTDAGVDRVHDVRFQIGDERAHKEEALVKATHHARKKAQKLADALDVTLGDVVALSEAMHRIHPPHPVPLRAMAMAKGTASPAPETSLPGLTTIHQSVTVTFALE